MLGNDVDYVREAGNAIFFCVKEDFTLLEKQFQFIHHRFICSYIIEREVTRLHNVSKECPKLYKKALTLAVVPARSNSFIVTLDMFFAVWRPQKRWNAITLFPSLRLRDCSSYNQCAVMAKNGCMSCFDHMSAVYETFPSAD